MNTREEARPMETGTHENTGHCAGGAGLRLCVARVKGRKAAQLPGSGVRRAGPAGREIDWVGVAVVDSQGLMKVQWAGCAAAAEDKQRQEQ